MEKYENLSEKFRRFFDIGTSPVAVKISNIQIDGQRPKQPSLFCDFVRRVARNGEALTIVETDLQNFTARVILGFTEPKYFDINPRIKPASTKSIVVAPLEKIREDPDVVIIITDPARMMGVVQTISRATRERFEAKMTCEASAVAGEVTAVPYIEKKPNLTLLCGGARTLAGYGDNEMVMGIPFDTFVKLIETLEFVV